MTNTEMLVEAIARELLNKGWDRDAAWVLHKNKCYLYLDFACGNLEGARSPVVKCSAGENWHLEKYCKYLLGGNIPSAAYKMYNGSASEKQQKIFNNLIESVDKIASGSELLHYLYYGEESTSVEKGNALKVVRSERNFTAGCLFKATELVSDFFDTAAVYRARGLEDGKIVCIKLADNLEDVDGSGSIAIPANYFAQMINSGEVYTVDAFVVSQQERVKVWKPSAYKKEVHAMLVQFEEFDLSIAQKAVLNEALHKHVNFTVLLNNGLHSKAARVLLDFLEEGLYVDGLQEKSAEELEVLLRIARSGGTIKHLLGSIPANMIQGVYDESKEALASLASQLQEQGYSKEATAFIINVALERQGYDHVLFNGEEVSSLALRHAEKKYPNPILRFIKENGFASKGFVHVPWSYVRVDIQMKLEKYFSLPDGVCIQGTPWSELYKRITMNPIALHFIQGRGACIGFVGHYLYRDENSVTITDARLVPVWNCVLVNDKIIVNNSTEDLVKL